MANFTNHRNRRSIRLKGYDYAQAGSYYITICVQDRLCLFGEVRNGEMMLNDAGKTIETVWFELKSRFPHIYLHEHITMPNHFHGILEIITSGNGQPQDMGQPQGIAPTSFLIVKRTSIDYDANKYHFTKQILFSRILQIVRNCDLTK